MRTPHIRRRTGREIDGSVTPQNCTASLPSTTRITSVLNTRCGGPFRSETTKFRLEACSGPSVGGIGFTGSYRYGRGVCGVFMAVMFGCTLPTRNVQKSEIRT